MADFPFDLVGFDLDGTLVDSAGDLAAAVNHALAAIGRAPLSVDRVATMIGRGGRAMLQAALRDTGGDEQLDRLLPIMFDHYEAHIADTTLPFAGVFTALDDLVARGVALAVVTNKRARFTGLLLRKLGLADRFGCVVSGDTLGGAMKPDPAPIREMLRLCCNGGRAAFVGDSIHDVAAAKGAGLPAVTFGPVDGADAWFDDFGQLVDRLVEVAGR